jgi:hypothetical protein
MALTAHTVVMGSSLAIAWRVPRNVVRVVTRSAGHDSFTFEEAPRFAQTVRGVRNLEIIAVRAVRGVIEKDHEVA